MAASVVLTGCSTEAGGRADGGTGSAASTTAAATGQASGPSATAGPPSTSAAPSSRSATTSPTSAAPSPATPPPVRLLHQGAPAEPGIEENTPWQTATLRVPVCWQDVPLAGAQERRAVSALVDMERWTEGLVVFATADQAVRFLELTRISVSECSAGDGSPWQGRQQKLVGAWGEGVAISFGSSTAPSQNPQVPLGETTLVVARVGRAVTYALRGSHGILGETVSQRGVAELRPALDHVAPQLCRYTVAGC